MDSPFGTYPLKYEVGVVTSYVTLRLSLQKVRYVVHLQWYSMSKSPTAWSNLYGAGALRMGEKMFSRDRKKITETSCPNRVP